MKAINFVDESNRLNIPLESIKSAFVTALRQGSIQGILNREKGEFIGFTPEEIEKLAGKVNSEQVNSKNLEDELRLTKDQVLTVLDYLLKEKRIKGVLTQKSEFLSEPSIKILVLKSLSKGISDEVEISKELEITAADHPRKIIESLRDQILVATAPYNQIKIVDLSEELKIPENALMPLLKKLILENRISARIDKVNGVLIVDKIESTSKKQSVNVESKNYPSTIYRSPPRSPTYSVPKRNPTSAWFLVAILFGIMGGLIGYVSVKDDDPDMAVNLLVIGILATIFYVIMTWAYYGWIISQIF